MLISMEKKEHNEAGIITELQEIMQNSITLEITSHGQRFKVAEAVNRMLRLLKQKGKLQKDFVDELEFFTKTYFAD